MWLAKVAFDLTQLAFTLSLAPTHSRTPNKTLLTEAFADEKALERIEFAAGDSA